MDQEPKLRSVPPTAAESRRDPPSQSEPDRPQNRTQLVLATALALALVLLLWSYISLGSRIDSLEGEAQLLRAAVAERDELINAQRARLDEVRGRVKDLLQIVEQPVTSAPAAGPEAPEASPAPPPEDP